MTNEEVVEFVTEGIDRNPNRVVCMGDIVHALRCSGGMNDVADEKFGGRRQAELKDFKPHLGDNRVLQVALHVLRDEVELPPCHMRGAEVRPGRYGCSCPSLVITPQGVSGYNCLICTHRETESAPETDKILNYILVLNVDGRTVCLSKITPRNWYWREGTDYINLEFKNLKFWLSGKIGEKILSEFTEDMISDNYKFKESGATLKFYRGS